VSFRHLGINAVFLRPRMGGLETYTKELIPQLLALRPGLRISVFVSPEGLPVLRDEAWAGDVTFQTHPLLGRRGLKAITETTLLGALAPRRGVDLLHSVALTAPLRTRAVNVITLADVTWLVAPDPGERGTVLVWRALVPPVARRADRIIAISHAGAEHVADRLHVPPERIDVVYPGFGIGTPPPPTPEAELRARLALPAGPLVLSVSAKKAHKNLRRLVAAMVAVRRRAPGAVLVLPGNPTAHEDELRALAAELGIAGAVAFPPYVDAADLEGLYAAASCFVFASVNEGFGLPILEAQRREVPVAASRVSSLPEAAGPGAHYFDPYDEADIARAVADVLTDPDLAARLTAAGRAHQAGFTWARAAEGTLDSYDRAWASARSNGPPAATMTA
jgi:glycosyltransferase involved in cell wall biosynthesis